MCCDDKQTSTNGGDRLEADQHSHPYDNSVTAWLIYQAVRFLNTAGKEGEVAYAQVTELLRRCNDDLLETVTSLFWQAKAGDTPLRWSLLYILGDSGDESVADFLAGTALAQLPGPNEDLCCEGPRDSEMLICTMAIHALQSVARRHPEVADLLLKIVAERPARPILIEG